MRFGSREVANVVFRARSQMTLGNRTFYKDEPVLYFDTLKTSGIEGAASTVYAQGGQGNPRLIAWEGDKTLTFTMEDALISPEGIAILAGAGLIGGSETEPIYVHTTSQVKAEAKDTVVVNLGKVGNIAWNGGRPVNSKAPKHITGVNPGVKVENNETYGDGFFYHDEADIFCMIMNADGEIEVEPCVPAKVIVRESTAIEGTYEAVITCNGDGQAVEGDHVDIQAGDVVLVDYYVKETTGFQVEITPNKFAGNFYIEADTLFRRESDGKDMPAEFVIPNGKVQSAFNFSMSNSGDPSTFTFTVDAFPAYPKFASATRYNKVLCLIQVIGGSSSEEDGFRPNCDPGKAPVKPPVNP